MTDYIFDINNTVVRSNDVYMKFYGRWYCIDMDVSDMFRRIKDTIEYLDSLEDTK